MSNTRHIITIIDVMPISLSYRHGFTVSMVNSSDQLQSPTFTLPHPSYRQYTRQVLRSGHTVNDTWIKHIHNIGQPFQS